MYRGEELWPEAIAEDMVFREVSDRKAIRTYPDLPPNLYESFLRTAERLPGKTAVVDHYGRAYTYEDLQKKTEVFSSWLFHTFGVCRGSHVAVMLYNSVEFCVAFLALNRLGAVMVPLPTKYRPGEVRSLTEKSDVESVICDEQFKEYMEEHLPVCVVPAGNRGYGLADFTVSEPECLPENPVNMSDPALLVFTSGTTSRSKGVVIRNYNIMHAIVSYERTLGIRQEDRSIIPIPIYLITGLVAVFGLMMHVGGTVYLHRFFDAVRVLEDMKKHEITFFHASPTVFSLLLNHTESFRELPSLRMFACGSSNMPPGKIKRLKRWLPDCEFRTVYGLTETTSPATVFPVDAGESPFLGASGIPIPGLEFQIVNPDGTEVPDGTLGEILVRGSNITSSYYKLETGAIRDEWLCTGDIGYFNEQGYLYIVDRKKDMINRGGEKVCSFDVENELLNLEGVEEAAVVGIPDELYGEVPAAVVRLKEGSGWSEKRLQEILKKRIAGYKVPVRILSVDAIPVTENMKTDKRYIREFLKADQEGDNKR